MTIIWFMVPQIWTATDRIICHFRPYFALFTLLITQKIKFWKTEKIPGDISIFHMCTINNDHMMYASWNMELNRHNLLSFGPFFALLPPNNNFEKNKKTPGYIILHKCIKNHDRTLYCSWDMTWWDVIFCSFWAIFCHFICPMAWKSKFFKNEKVSSCSYHFTHMYQKLWSHDVWFLRYGAWQTNEQMERWTDTQTEKVTYRDGCPT